ncbi:MAG: ATP-dependent Clp protease ATP-binding subunit [Lentisphaerae bacterium]|nr:ATP-dependent Clp protease ATP-binding subunit [Lentisphaerota bacterium]
MSEFTPRAQQVIQLARKEAERFNHAYIGTEHLLLGLIALGEGVAVAVLEKMGVDLDILRLEVEKAAPQGPDTQTIGAPPMTPRAKKVLALAKVEAQALNHGYVGTEHILLGLLREEEGISARVLRNLNVDIERARLEVLRELNPNVEAEQAAEASPPVAAGATAPARAQPVKTPALNAFSRNLTELARQGKLDPVIGRSEETKRMIQILCRRTKNNPVLLGEAGVGKTAIVEGLAQTIAAGDAPELLANKEVVMLDMALMVAGTKYRGQFEERIKAVMDELRRSKNFILFMDELHTIVGAGAAEGAMDASNIIKPALARGELQCIGATTMNEYRKYIEKDAALERRFQTIIVDEPTVEETIQILKGLQGRYEEHHKVKFAEAALEAAARLSARYISGRFLPDKAIDVLDEAGAQAHIGVMTRPPKLKKAEKKIIELKQRKEETIRTQKFEEAAKWRDQERTEREKLDRVLAKWRKGQDRKVVAVKEAEIMAVIARWTGVPLTRLDESETKRLLNMEQELAKAIVGQGEAVAAISRALRRSRADLKDPRRPIGSFIFLGPTGVGKTLMAKVLAEYMFNDRDALIQLDMSEYMDKFMVSRMVGSPPGYIGHEEGGQLTEKVRRKPYAVVLFDEIEKAHPEVMDILLQILEEGMLTDSLGRRVSFRNTVIIMTSNLGSKFARGTGGLGFATGTATAQVEGLKTQMLDEAKHVFKPELINRLDDMIVFRPLSREDVAAILELEMAQVRARMATKHVEIRLTPEAKAFLIEKGFDEVYGVRPLRRAIEKFVQDPLAEEILAGRLGAAPAVEVQRAGEKLTFVPVVASAPADEPATEKSVESKPAPQPKEISSSGGSAYGGNH